ncbi:hydroxyproline O-galactosyltransferase HPGT1-like [Andrographis paniculata]|uniref:hydroxyproline O-galactosyltransferase HPGT1-like n=1 Tax=Andrographis paniculata TaxID=175694 RepID=UPI0021E6EA52|nr:hydroxyproline O-galactosyltransferase HPGT1-like [Andrographis paniculata]
MQSKGSSARFTGLAIRSRISTLMFSMFATFASLYVAGRLWQDAENRVYLVKELDRITGQGKSVMTVDESWKIIDCRERLKKLSELEMELAAARQEGFQSKLLSEYNKNSKRRPLVVIGIFTGFDRKSHRDAIRKAWMGTGKTLTKLEEQKGIVIRFVIGRSPNRGDSFDRSIDNENRQTHDLFILEDHVEAPEELPKKTKLFFAHAAEFWDSDYFAKVNDDVYLNVDGLSNILSAHFNKPRAYIGCMKSGEVFSEKGQKWYEPEWWKFGDGKNYFRHASGEIFVISQALAKFVSINRSILRVYAHDDVSVGSWFIGADVNHVDERKFCCSSWSSGAICSGV